MANSAKRKGVLKATSREVEQSAKELEGVVRAVIEELQRRGIRVRREELRRGPGWRAVSGACRIESERFLFLDRTLAVREQLEFLVTRLAEAARLNPSGDPIPEELLHKLPESMRDLMQVPAVAA